MRIRQELADAGKPAESRFGVRKQRDEPSRELEGPRQRHPEVRDIGVCLDGRRASPNVGVGSQRDPRAAACATITKTTMHVRDVPGLERVCSSEVQQLRQDPIDARLVFVGAHGEPATRRAPRRVFLEDLVIDSWTSVPA